MRSKGLICSICLLTILLTGCKKSGDPNVNVYANADVYLVGASATGQATYWKNGVPTYLTGGVARSIFIDGKDVYVAGNSADANGNSVVTYWKNGVATHLTQGLEINYANAIVVKDADVYVVGVTMNGYGQGVAMYWKNGVATALPGSSSYYDSSANAIAVAGNDVYIGGYTTDDNDNFIPTYWKNGVPAYLSNNGTNAVVNAIAVNGTDIYAAGSSDSANYNFSIGQSSKATYWKNGGEEILEAAGNSSAATDLIISNTNDIYIAGVVMNANSKYVRTYWKNGTPTSLPIPNTQYSEYSTTNLAIAGNDIYITGQSGAGYGFWKNSTAVQITGNPLYISGIKVVPK